MFLLWLLSQTVSAIIVPELGEWREDRYVDCTFCVDYDDMRKAQVTSCSEGPPTSCWGNTCYMRQHKSRQFFLYTSGCLNLTSLEFAAIRLAEDLDSRKVGGTGKETLLCEVSKKTNTCLCVGDHCNNMTNPDPFTEYHTTSLFEHLNFHEVLQFRLFLPNSAVLKNFDKAELDKQLRRSVPRYVPTSNSNFSVFFIVVLVLSLLSL